MIDKLVEKIKRQERRSKSVLTRCWLMFRILFRRKLLKRMVKL